NSGGRAFRKHRAVWRCRAEPGAWRLRESVFQVAAADRTIRLVFRSDACRPPSYLIRNGLTGGRHLASFDEKFSIINFVAILEQATLGRARGARTVLVIRYAVTGTHKKI